MLEPPSACQRVLPGQDIALDIARKREPADCRQYAAARRPETQVVLPVNLARLIIDGLNHARIGIRS